MADRILIVCPSCGKRVSTPRCNTDPASATEVRGIRCIDCDNGGFGLPEFFDAHGNQISGEP